MPRAVRTRGPASPAAEEHDHRTNILRLSEVDVRCLRRASEAGPVHSPRDAMAICAERADELALAVDQLRRHLAEAGEPRLIGGRIILRARLYDRGGDYSQAREHGKHGGGAFGHNSPPYVEWVILMVIAA